MEQGRVCLKVTLCLALLLAMAAPVRAVAEEGNTQAVTLMLTSRDAGGHISQRAEVLPASRLAIIVMEVWDSHPDPVEASRVAALIPRMNKVLNAARHLGIQVIFSPNEVPMPAGADTNVFQTLPEQEQVDNGFTAPNPPYFNSDWGDMVPIAYDSAHHPRFAHWSRQHPDLIVKPGDLASVNRQQIYDYCVAKGITHLLYMGSAANMCIADTRAISMEPMRRYCGLSCLLVCDLSTSMTLNGRKATGNNNSTANTDLEMTPDAGDWEVDASDETNLCAGIHSRQLLWNWHPASYTSLITSDPSLLCDWPMDSKASYQEMLDVRRCQSCWWNQSDRQQTRGLTFDVPGVIVGEPDTAVQFDGSGTILVSPHYRVDIPRDSPLASLSSTNFTLEMWVRIDHLSESNQWFFSHDDGVAHLAEDSDHQSSFARPTFSEDEASGDVDVLLGLNSNGHFEFVVGRDPTSGGFGDVVQSSTAVTPADVAAKRWFYLVAEHDKSHGMVSLSVDARAADTAPDHCAPVTLTAAPHFGSRGRVEMDDDGLLANCGFEGFHGELDQVAIYSSVLDRSAIQAHYAVGTGRLTFGHNPIFFSQSFETNGTLRLSLIGMKDATYVIEASTNLVNWRSLSTNMASSEVFEVTDTNAMQHSRRYYRALEIP